MENQDERNWVKLNQLLNKSCELLRELFVRTWKIKFGSEWNKGCAPLILGHTQFQNVQPLQRKNIKEGVVEKWDLPTLKTVLIAEHFLELPSDQTRRIVQIMKIHNKIGRLPTKVVPEKQFNDFWNELERTLFYFGLLDSDLQNINPELFRQLDGVKFATAGYVLDEVTLEEAARLKEEGSLLCTKGAYSEAITLFTQGLELPGLSDADRAMLYSNRCAAFLNLYNASQDEDNLSKAKADAEKAIELQPDWWRGYFCLGKIYTALEKGDIADLSVDDAVVKEAYRQEGIDTLSKNEQYKKKMDDLNLDLSVTLSCDIPPLEEKLAFNANTNSIPENVNSSEDVGNYLRLNQDGVADFPNIAHLASQSYKKLVDRESIDRMYNLRSVLPDGDGMEQEFELGLKLLKEAVVLPITALDGVPKDSVAKVEFSLGLCYYEGVGVCKNAAEALCWFERSSGHGYSKAATKLGMMYEDGEVDNKPDLLKAEQYYKLAVKTRPDQKPDSYAMFHLARLYLKKGDYEKALESCRQAKDCGNLHPMVDQLISDATDRINSFMKSGVIAWELENGITSVCMTMAEREEQYYCESDPALAAEIANIKLLHSKMTRCSLTTSTRKPRVDPCELEECAKYSAYARSLWTAQKHFLKAVCVMMYEIKSCKNPSMEVYERFVTHFSAAVQTDSVVVEIETEWHQQAWSIVTELLKQNTPFDEDVRICYATFQVLSSPELALGFLDDCLQKYPKHFFFLKFHAAMCAMLKRWEEGMEDVNVLVQMDSHNPEVLLILAGLVKLSVPSVPAEVAVEAYVDFIAHAPEGHRAIPESYYAIASLIYNSQLSAHSDRNTNLAEVKRYYELGLAVEKKQLSFFLPYQSNTKAIVEYYLSEWSKLQPNPQCDSGLSSEKGLSDPNLRSQKLSDPNRIALIKDYRRFAGKCRHIGSQFSLSFTAPSPPRLPSPLDLPGLKEISLRDVDPTKDFIYEGCFFSVTVIDEVGFTDSSIVLLVEDSNGDVERCGLYNWPQTEDVACARQAYGLGCKLRILNPHTKIALDGKAIIQVDDPLSLVRLGFVRKLCRYCGQPDADKLCSRCKNALYCDKTCQVLDWKILKHKLICCN